MLAFFPALSLSLVAGPALRSSSRLPHARAASPTLLFLDQLILAAHSSTAHGSLEVMQTTMQTNLHHALPHLFPAPVPEVISPIEHLHALYVNSLETHYYRTTAIQATVLVGLGDLGAQLIERRATGDAYEPQRTLRMAVLGLFIAGFGTSTWLRLLEAALPGNGTPEIVVEKACLDACIWAPIANTLYLVLTPLLEGDSPAEVQQQLESKFLPVMKTELATFLPYNLVSFSLVPPLVRPFTTGFISMCFAVYISWITHVNGEQSQQLEQSQQPQPIKGSA